MLFFVIKTKLILKSGYVAGGLLKGFQLNVKNLIGKGSNRAQGQLKKISDVTHCPTHLGEYWDHLQSLKSTDPGSHL